MVQGNLPRHVCRFGQKLVSCHTKRPSLPVRAESSLDGFAVVPVTRAVPYAPARRRRRFDLVGIGERRRVVRRREQDNIAERHEVDYAPQVPPASFPARGRFARAACTCETVKDVDHRLHPRGGRAVDGVHDDRGGDPPLRQDAGPALVTLERPGVPEVVVTLDGPAGDAEPVVGLRRRRLRPPMPADHFPATGH